MTIVFVCSGISTHALTEGDFILKYQDNIRFLFQLTPSRRATCGVENIMEGAGFQLTPSRRATHDCSDFSDSRVISTHALTEGDEGFSARCDEYAISTHALTEGDQGGTEEVPKPEHFNSRPHGGRLRSQ